MIISVNTQILIFSCIQLFIRLICFFFDARYTTSHQADIDDVWRNTSKITSAIWKHLQNSSNPEVESYGMKILIKHASFTRLIGRNISFNMSFNMSLNMSSNMRSNRSVNDLPTGLSMVFQQICQKSSNRSFNESSWRSSWRFHQRSRRCVRQGLIGV